MDKEKSEAKISIESSREELIAKLKRNCRGGSIEKVIPFTNHDVPDYLKRLKSIEEDSRKTGITVI